MAAHPGIAPSVLVSQIANTAAWIVDASDLEPAAIARRATDIEARWKIDPRDVAYFELLLAAHFLTVATFVPTDVDARIRHHGWVEAERPQLAAQLDVVDRAATWDPRRVSARTVTSPDGAITICGHDGEWLSVWAGALGRALMLEDEVAIERVTTAIDASLVRQAAVYSALEKQPDRTFDVLRAATVLAHNAGDLSRVVEQWPRRPHLELLRGRFMKLGHERADRYGGAFVRAGVVNKALTAIENHRFLALRAPRGLRRSRALLLPIGPFFDDWGKDVARSPELESGDRAEVVEAMLETHLRDPLQLGCLRALSAMHEHAPGGLDRIAPDLPARMRKLVSAGAVREAAKTTRTTFEARLMKQARVVIESTRP